MIDKCTNALVKQYFNRPEHIREISVTAADQNDLIIAVLKALYEPSEAMLEACKDIMGGGFQNSHSDKETWQTMLDVVLQENY